MNQNITDVIGCDVTTRDRIYSTFHQTPCVNAWR